MSTRRGSSTQVASSTPFDNSVVQIPNNPQTTQKAIEELYEITQSSSRGFTFCQYGGNANVGRYLEFFSGIDSSQAPIYTPTPFSVLTVVARATANSTCTIGFYDISSTPVLLYTVTFTAQNTSVVDNPLGLFTVPAMGSLAVKIDSGSISKPHIYLIVKGV